MKSSDGKLRLLIVYDALQRSPKTVRELQDIVEAVLGFRPERKTIYNDITNIELIAPLKRTGGRGKPTVWERVRI